MMMMHFLALINIGYVSSSNEGSPAAVVAAGLNKLYFESFTMWGKTVKAAVQDAKFVEYGNVDINSKAFFESKPLVVFGGQFSTGKTTCIQDLLLGKPYPDSDVGSAATTSKFIVIQPPLDDSTSAATETGRSLAAQPSKPFEPYSKLPNSEDFLKIFAGANVRGVPLLDEVVLVDTPGILSKNREQGASLLPAWKMLATHADRIIVMFDIKSADISDQYTDVLRQFAKYEEKVHFVFNKVDTLNTADLMRSYGALMWQLGRVFKRPEAVKIWFGSLQAGACQSPPASESVCSLANTTKDYFLGMVDELPLETPLRRLAGFEGFLERVEVHIALTVALRKLLKHDGKGWLRQCSNTDVLGRSLLDEQVLIHHIKRISAKEDWSDSLRPDPEDFARQIRKKGGACGLPVFSKDGAKLVEVLTSAKKGLKDLYTKLGASDNRFTSKSVRDAVLRAKENGDDAVDVGRVRTDL